MKLQRAAGVLMHPTSFPGPYGVGELGKEAYAFVDFLEKAGQKLWQVLPLGPTGYGDSPYASFSTYAGNPLLISLEKLIQDGDLKAQDIADVPPFNPELIDSSWIQYWKFPILRKAAQNFLDHAGADRKKAFEAFVKEESSWLVDYALFTAVKAHYQKIADEKKLMGKMWSNFWDKDIALREPEAVKAWTKKLSVEIAIVQVQQFYFYQQWLDLRRYANAKGIQIVGDIPIFVASDSSDVWSHREFFLLKEDGQPSVVAGVPPDYFSATGQLWGNPLYNWEAIEKNKFAWWIDRIKATLKLVDIIRIDHFRGFEAYWEIPATDTTAVGGKWVKAPGMKLFAQVKKVLGKLPILAEDLGVITPEVEEMRDTFEFPGMKILQFAFDSGEAGASGDNPFLPHNYNQNCVVYTGSHDNDTLMGWYKSSKPSDQKYSREYLGIRDGESVSWGFIRGALASTAVYAVIPAQDLLGLGAEARMNTPSTLGNNWGWRVASGALNDEVAQQLKELVRLYGRA